MADEKPINALRSKLKLEGRIPLQIRTPAEVVADGGEKAFDAVRLMRELRDRVTRELDGLTFEEQRRHIHEQIAAARKQPRSSLPTGKGE